MPRMTRPGFPKVLLSVLLAALTIFTTASHAAPRSFSAEVTHITDGDTLWVRIDGDHGKPIKLRLLGIDAPERCQAGGAQATAALASRVLHQRVQVRTRAKDDYQRSLAQLRLGDEDIAAWMVSRGYAWSYRYHRSLGPYAAQEGAARAAGLGIFADPAAIEPRDFRKRFGPCH
jgi:endonuclease YncB( thermonuclease family)